MFKEEKIFMAINGARYENGHYVFAEASAYSLYGGSEKQLPIDNIKPNTRYTITISGYIEQYAFIMMAYFNNDNNDYQYINFTNTEETKQSFITAAGKSVTKFTITYYSTGIAHISHLQLEEGSTATEYEPYYITEDTKVVQTSNHTLKAIWEEN